MDFLDLRRWVCDAERPIHGRYVFSCSLCFSNFSIMMTPRGHKSSSSTSGPIPTAGRKQCLQKPQQQIFSTCLKSISYHTSQNAANLGTITNGLLWRTGSRCPSRRIDNCHRRPTIVSCLAWNVKKSKGNGRSIETNLRLNKRYPKSMEIAAKSKSQCEECIQTLHFLHTSPLNE